MYDTAERLRRVKLRARELRCNKETDCWAVCPLYADMLVSITGVIGIMTGGAPGMVSGFYGATLLYDDAGPMSWWGCWPLAGVIVTMLCLSTGGKQMGEYNEKEKTKQKKDC